MPKYHFQRAEVLTKEEVATMIAGTDSVAMKGLIAFLYIFGCRITEALKLNKADVKLYEKSLTVRLLTLKRREKGAVLPSRKNTATLSAPFMGYFLAQLGMVSEGKIWRMSRVTAWRKMKKLNSLCSPHQFRHARATHFAEVTDDVLAMVDWFGWASTDTALRYVHLSGRGAAKLAAKIE